MSRGPETFKYRYLCDYYYIRIAQMVREGRRHVSAVSPPRTQQLGHFFHDGFHPRARAWRSIAAVAWPRVVVTVLICVAAVQIPSATATLSVLLAAHTTLKPIVAARLILAADGGLAALVSCWVAKAGARHWSICWAACREEARSVVRVDAVDGARGAAVADHRLTTLARIAFRGRRGAAGSAGFAVAKSFRGAIVAPRTSGDRFAGRRRSVDRTWIGCSPTGGWQWLRAFFALNQGLRSDHQSCNGGNDNCKNGNST